MAKKHLRCTWEVTGAIIPGQPLPELTKQFHYTVEEYREDKEKPPSAITIFTTRLLEAHDYATQLTNPASLNHVRIDWIWY